MEDRVLGHGEGEGQAQDEEAVQGHGWSWEEAGEEEWPEVDACVDVGTEENAKGQDAEEYEEEDEAMQEPQGDDEEEHQEGQGNGLEECLAEFEEEGSGSVGETEKEKKRGNRHPRRVH